MKIAVYHDLPSGGGKRALFEQVSRLAQHHILDVFTLSSADHDFADIRPFVRSHAIQPFNLPVLFRSPWGRLNQLLRLLNLRRLVALAPAIATQIDAGDYDVALVHVCMVENSPSILRYLQRVPAVFYCQEALRVLHEVAPYRPYTRSQSRVRQLLDRVDPLPGLYRGGLRRNDINNLRAATRVLVNSEFTRRNVESIYNRPVDVCYLGVDTHLFRPLYLNREAFVLSVGSLTPLKCFDFLIQSLAALPSAQRPRLVIASNFQNPEEKIYLERMASELQVQIVLQHMLPDEELVKLYNQASLVAYAPHREPFGFVPLEAMACATPVVAVAEGGVLETIQPGENGLLVERDPAAMAHAIQSLFEQPALAQRLGQNGLSGVQKQWSWEHSVQRLEAHLSESAARGLAASY